MHVHPGHERCLEVSVLKAEVSAVRASADALTAQRGVRHANLHIVPVEQLDGRHSHGGRETAHLHVRI